jgi:hypothetical protein
MLRTARNARTRIPDYYSVFNLASRPSRRTLSHGAETGLHVRKPLSRALLPTHPGPYTGINEYQDRIRGDTGRGKWFSMAECKFCSERIHWAKGVPWDWKGDHRENCLAMSPQTRERVKLENHEKRVGKFFASLPRRKRR